MASCIRMLILVLFITSSLAAEEEYVICVDLHESGHDSECDSVFTNLSMAFDKYRLSNNTKFVIYPGTYNLPVIAFIHVSDMMIEGRMGEVVFDCHEQGGLLFQACNNVSLINISFQECGAKLPEAPTANEPLNATLQFFQCFDVSLMSVSVFNSVGLSVFSNGTLGINNIASSNFSGNTFGMVFILQSITGSTTIIEGTIFEFTKGNSDVTKHVFLFSNESHYDIGGGLMISIQNHADNNNFIIRDCHFNYNRGIYGGGMFVSITSNATNNLIDISNTTFFRNNASQGGGGVRLQVSYKDDAIPQRNNVTIAKSHFICNKATFGGGLSLIADHGSNQFIFFESQWISNIANTGSAITLSSWVLASFNSLVIPQPHFTSCTFYNNTKFITELLGKSVHSTGGTFYIESVSVHFKQINFTNNVGTAVYAINGKVNFEKDSIGVFVSNSGNDGGALSLIGDSVLILAQNVTLNFTGNNATGYGSAIYAFITRQYKDSMFFDCFVRYRNEMVSPNEWNVTIIFRKNSNRIKDTIFSTDINFCKYHKNFLLFCNHQWNFGPNTECKREVKTLPALIQFKSPYDKIATPPGNVTLMNLNATDDNNNTVNSYFVIAQNTSQTKVADYFQYVSDDHIKLQVLSGSSFSNASSNLSDTVELRTTFPRVLEVRVPVTALPCPPGFFLSIFSGLCECSQRSFGGGIIHCLNNFTALIRTRHWIGYSNYTDSVVVGRCRFCAARITNSINGFITLPSSYEQVNDVLCGGDKQGVLCTKCQNASFALNILNFECLDCSSKTYRYTWIYVILTQLLPVILLFLILLLTNFHLASGNLNGAIFFAQTITTSLDISGNGDIPINSIIKSDTNTKILLTVYSVLYSIWNLDFIEPIKYCLAPNLSLNTIFVWEYAVAVLPLIFVGIMYVYFLLDNRINFECCFKVNACIRFYEFWKSKVEQKEALRNILSSCIILAYTRCTLNTLYILNPTYLRDNRGHVVTTVPYFDGSTKYGQGHHITYMIIALIILFVFLLPVPALLLFRRHNSDVERGQPFLNVLLTSFQQDFKSPDRESIGPNKTAVVKWLYNKWIYDKRWVPGLYFLLRVALSVAFVLSPNFLMQAIIQQLLAVLMAAVFLLLRPYKLDKHNSIDGFIFLLIIIINSISIYQYALSMAMENLSLTAFIIQYILVYIPMIWIAFYILKKIKSSCKKRAEYVPISKASANSKSKYASTPM